MEVKILGVGCPKCKRLEQLACEAIEALGIEAEIVHVTKMADILEYPILSTPGVVINQELKSSGRLPRKEEIMTWMREAQ